MSYVYLIYRGLSWIEPAYEYVTFFTCSECEWIVPGTITE
jgi:hypothetical protein